MEKITRFRNTQAKAIDDFINDILDNPCCKYCISHDECQEAMGVTNIDEEIGGYGCQAFDNTIDNLVKIYLNT